MLPESFTKAVEQPYEIDIALADDIFVKQIHVPKAHTYLPQHSHEYDHTTLLARGSVEVWLDEESLGVFFAPKPILILAGRKHLFCTLEDDTVIYCIHNVSRAGVIEVRDEHHLVDGN